MAPSTITIDVEEFTRTRDALTTALLALSSSVDRAVKAYVQHSNSVVVGDEALTNAILAQPFGAIAAAASTVAAIKAADEEEVEEGDKKRKRTYKPRDPNAPKRPLTAYFRFLGEMRPLLANELAKTGKHAPGELSKLATERWNAMSQETKQPYHDAYKAAKLNYEKEVEAYKATTGVESFEDAVEAIEESISDEEPAPAPAPVPTPKKAKKAASPEATKKAPKVAAASTPAATEKTPKPTTSKKKATATPMFNSINPSSSAPAATPAGKKRKAEAAPAATPAADAESPPKKKKVGRPSLSAEQKALNAAEKKKAKKAEKAAEA